MHIADGVLSGPILVGGFTLAVGGIALGLKKVDHDAIPRVAMLSAAFFVASLVHVPVGPGQVHLLLNGLVGILLGWAAFPSLFIGLLLQAVIFGYGGITVLGVNTVIMAVPAVICHYIFRLWYREKMVDRSLFIQAAVMALLANILSSFLLALFLFLTDKHFAGVIGLIIMAHIPIIIIEAPLVGAVVVFIRKARGDLLHGVAEK